jgi:hypothetical protein
MRTENYSDYIQAGECCWPECQEPRLNGRWTQGAGYSCAQHRPIYDQIRMHFDDVSPRMLQLRRETGLAYQRGTFNNGRQHCMTPGCSARRTHESEYCQKCLEDEASDMAIVGY